MDELLFNSLFDRETDNPDFLRGRIASCIKEISQDMIEHNNGNYTQDFYMSTIRLNDALIDKFGIYFLSSTLDEIAIFRNFLFALFNHDNPVILLKGKKHINFLKNFTKLVENIGYTKRSRILRRYSNFVKISNNFLNGKIPKNEYRAEILNQIVFFDDMLKQLKPAQNVDICIYYFVYDIRSSKNLKRLKLEKVDNN